MRDTQSIQPIQWLTGQYDGYGIREYPDGRVDVYGQSPAPPGVLCSCGSWADARDFMEHDGD